MNLEEFRTNFKKPNTGGFFYARPIFNDDFMGRLSELFSKDKYNRFEELIDNDNSIGLKKFFKKNYHLNKNSYTNIFYQQKVSIEFDICLNQNLEAENPYYLGFYSENISLHTVIKMLQIYFNDNESTSWLQGKIISEKDDKQYDTKEFVLDGYLMFAASPVLEKKVSLRFLGETKPLQDKYELINHFRSIYNKFKKNIFVFENKPLTDKDIHLSAKELCCNNVGQANCIKITGLNNENIYFDVGLTRYIAEKNQKEIASNIEKLKKQVPDIIILSHWDTDHILGLSFWDESVYNKKWIVPDLYSLLFRTDNDKERKAKQVSSYAVAIFLKLIQYNYLNIYVISERLENACIYKKEYINSPGIEIWTGKRASSGSKNTHVINRANNFGLIMVIHGYYQNIILCGDCDYNVIPKSLRQQKYDCVVVSHHGSKMGDFPFKPEGTADSTAIVSYGLSNPFGHPNSSKMTEISEKGYQIISTIGRFNYTVTIHDEGEIKLRGV